MSSRSQRRRSWVGACCLVVSLALAGCTGDDQGMPSEGTADDAATQDPAAGPAQAPSRSSVDPRFSLVQQLLDARAKAVRTGDLAAFTAGLARRPDVDRGFRKQQRRWFRNLQRLPVGVLRYQVIAKQWTPDEIDRRRADAAGVFLPVVTTSLRLRGYDDEPVSRVAGVTVVRTDQGYRIASVDDVDTRPDPAIGDAPWDLVDLEVRTQGDVGRTLLLLDEASADLDDTLLSLLAEGTARVREAIPFDWDGSVVAYATGADEVIASIGNVPGGDVAQVGALSFPVYASSSTRSIAAFRFALNPDVLGSDPLFLRRLVTHELSHVAIGTRDDGAPTWVSEGVAEYVGALGLDPTSTRIAVSVVDRARSIRLALDAGESRTLALPPSKTFNGPEADWHYGLSWYVAEWIVENRGEDTLWRLVRAMAEGSGTPDARQDAVLRRVVGLDGAALVERAVDLILATYDR